MPNPIHALKIIICNSNHTNDTKIPFRKIQTVSKLFESVKQQYYISNFHNSYFIYIVYFIYSIYFVYFVYFVTGKRASLTYVDMWPGGRVAGWLSGWSGGQSGRWPGGQVAGWHQIPGGS